jgi:hypothetical protein
MRVLPIARKPIEAFPIEQVSFTYTDSMISHWLRSQTDQAFYRPEYHGRMFGLSLIQLIQQRQSPCSIAPCGQRPKPIVGIKLGERDR